MCFDRLLLRSTPDELELVLSKVAPSDLQCFACASRGGTDAVLQYIVKPQVFGRLWACAWPEPVVLFRGRLNSELVRTMVLPSWFFRREGTLQEAVRLDIKPPFVGSDCGPGDRAATSSPSPCVLMAWSVSVDWYVRSATRPEGGSRSVSLRCVIDGRDGKFGLGRRKEGACTHRLVSSRVRWAFRNQFVSAFMGRNSLSRPKVEASTNSDGTIVLTMQPENGADRISTMVFPDAELRAALWFYARLYGPAASGRRETDRDVESASARV